MSERWNIIQTWKKIVVSCFDMTKLLCDIYIPVLQISLMLITVNNYIKHVANIVQNTLMCESYNDLSIVWLMDSP